MWRCSSSKRVTASSLASPLSLSHSSPSTSIAANDSSDVHSQPLVSTLPLHCPLRSTAPRGTRGRLMTTPIHRALVLVTDHALRPVCRKENLPLKVRNSVLPSPGCCVLLAVAAGRRRRPHLRPRPHMTPLARADPLVRRNRSSTSWSLRSSLGRTPTGPSSLSSSGHTVAAPPRGERSAHPLCPSRLPQIVHAAPHWPRDVLYAGCLGLQRLDHHVRPALSRFALQSGVARLVLGRSLSGCRRRTLTLSLL